MDLGKPLRFRYPPTPLSANLGFKLTSKLRNHDWTLKLGVASKYGHRLTDRREWAILLEWSRYLRSERVNNLWGWKLNKIKCFIVFWVLQHWHCYSVLLVLYSQTSPGRDRWQFYSIECCASVREPGVVIPTVYRREIEHVRRAITHESLLLHPILTRSCSCE